MKAFIEVTLNQMKSRFILLKEDKNFISEKFLVALRKITVY